MEQRGTGKRISELGDVELIKLLTVDAARQSPEIISIATAEAQRRELPIDERFIPSVLEQSTSSQGHAPCRFVAGDTPIRCPQCGSDRFEARDILLNTRGLTFLKLDWLNRSAQALACAKCSAIQLFAVSPVAVDDDQ